MKRPEHPLKRHLGFTLAEMAIVIVIVGILLTLGLGLATSQLAATQKTATQASLTYARDALLGFFASNHRFPCPDNTRTGVESIIGNPIPPTPNALGTAQCAAAIGTIPYQTIGMQKSQALDAYGNFITYVIDPQKVGAVWVWANKMRMDTTFTSCSTAGTATVDGGPRGELRVMQNAGEETSFNAAAPLLRNRAVFVLISHGANALGAWSPNGTRHALPPAGSPERPNTAANLTPAPPAAPNSYNDFTFSDSAAAPFDDLVVFVTEQSGSPASASAGGGLHTFMVSQLHRSDICS